MPGDRTPDRKALIREYKQTPRTMGVGAVRNTANGRTLLNRQRAQLRLNVHSNRALQADWNSLGADAFEFVVLDTLAPTPVPDYDPTADLHTLEALWIEKLNPFEPTGYHRRQE
jgi:hypothetical protein